VVILGGWVYLMSEVPLYLFCFSLLDSGPSKLRTHTIARVALIQPQA